MEIGAAGGTGTEDGHGAHRTGDVVGASAHAGAPTTTADVAGPPGPRDPGDGAHPTGGTAPEDRRGGAGRASGPAPAAGEPGTGSEASDAAQSAWPAANLEGPGAADEERVGRRGGAERGGRSAGVVPPASLSPSRASDFMQCPLLYRFRVIDRLPEKPSAAATRGTLVHAVLERLFDAPAAQRTADRAKGLVPGQWERLRRARPELEELFSGADEDEAGAAMARWLGEVEELVERWFTLEDPTRLEPAERELFVETRLDSGLRLRGVIDRVDVAPTGEVRIVDYKTGKAPRPEYAQGALFQMNFYALVVWRLKGIVPRRLQLVYLGSGDVVTHDPVRSELEAVERKLLALWQAIRRATETGDWRPRRSRLCDWCDHQARCPEFGGTPPPYPLPLALPLGADDPRPAAQGRMGWP